MSKWLNKIRVEPQKPKGGGKSEKMVNLTIKVRNRARRDWWVFQAKSTRAGSLSRWVEEQCIREFGEPPGEA